LNIFLAPEKVERWTSTDIINRLLSEIIRGSVDVKPVPSPGAGFPFGRENSMISRSCRLLLIAAVVGTNSTALSEDKGALTNEVPGWGRIVDPGQDCEVSLNPERDRLKMSVPGTPHVLSAEAPNLPMNAPRVVRRVRGDFTASVRVLGRLEPGRSKTTFYDPFHGAGLIVWQDSSNYLRLERAVGFIKRRYQPYINYELRQSGRLAMSHGITIEDRSHFLKLRREGQVFSAWYSRDGRRWAELAKIESDLSERVEVGVVAVNSAERILSAELERFSIQDPQGSMARDYADDDEGRMSPPSPSAEEISRAPGRSL
jgi:regulation of enolase protein 1 (concanavalin A-like superfamily)